MTSRYRIHLIAAGLYLLLTLVLTWPLTANIGTHVPGEATWAFDESTFLWNMWWLKFSLLNLGQNPLQSTHTFFPLGISLTTYTFNLFNSALGLPLQLALSVPLANNLILLFSYVSSAYGAFLLGVYLLRRARYGVQISYLAAFIVGAVYAFSASRMMYVALGHYNFVTIQWFPFFVIFLLKALRQGTAKNIFLAGLFAAFCVYAELTYSVFLLFLTLLLLAGELVSGRTKQNRPKPATYLYRGALIGVTTLILILPFVLAVLPDFLDPAYSRPGWGEGLNLSADLAGLLTLTPLHPLAGVDWVAELRSVIEGTSRFSDANTLFLGYGILIVALLGFFTNRAKARVWLWTAIFFAILSLGPLLTINGRNRFDLDGIEATFPLPFALLHYIPVLSANRVPNRFGIPLTLALAVLAGYGTAWILSRLAGRRAHQTPEKAPASGKTNQNFRVSRLVAVASLAFLLVLLLFDQFSVPLPLTDARIPDVYHQIGAEPGDFTVMQLPLGWRNSYGTLGAERTQLQYFQAAHQRPMLGGNTSRNPNFKFEYFARIPLFKALTETELYRVVPGPILEQARQQAGDLMTLYNVKYLAVHESIPLRKPYEDTYQPTRDLALDLIPHQAEPVYQSTEHGVQIFSVQQAPIPQPFQIDFGTETGLPYLGQGWADNEVAFGTTAVWATAPEAEIFFPVRGGGERKLALQIAPFSYPDMPSQQIDLGLNGHELGHNQSLREGWQMIEVGLPADKLVNGLNRLVLQFTHTAQPRQALPGANNIGDTGLLTPVDLEVNSGGDFAFITVGFGEAAVDASAHRRGLNIAVIDPKSGAVTSSQGFDTAANQYEAEALVQFLADVPSGQIVILATQGPDAGTYFTEAVGRALKQLGLPADPPPPPFSAIGVKNAPEGTAALASGEGSAYLRLGSSPDIRDLAAAVDFVTITSPTPEQAEDKE
jgi:hypothetical protein